MFIYIWHKNFDEAELKFYIYAWYDEKKHKVWLGACLDGEEYKMEQTSAMLQQLKEVLSIDDNDFHKDILNPNKQIYITLAQERNVDVVDFTQEEFMEFFKSMKDKVDEFNQKIKDDLAKKDSKLRTFLLD